MKSKLIFDLSEERIEYNLALNGSKFYCRILDYSNELRSKLKYGNLSNEEYRITEKMYESFNEFFNDIINDENFM